MSCCPPCRPPSSRSRCQPRGPLSSAIEVRWRNPLPIPLTDCRLEVAASGVVIHSAEIGELAAGAELSESAPLATPGAARRWANGHAQVVATFTSKELHDVVGRADIQMG